MEDTPRLVKRSQYKILGKTPESLDLSHDVHLRDYEEEIFYDDDFYRQVRKTCNFASVFFMTITNSYFKH